MKTRPTASHDIWITGFNPGREALLTGRVPVLELVLSRSDPRSRELHELGIKRGIPVRRETGEEISALVGHSHHQGVALRMKEYPYVSVESLLGRPSGEREPLVILDCLQDPQNFGALMRSACFLGARGVIVPKDRSVGITATVVKVSSGAISYLPVALVGNLVRTIEELKERGLWIAGLDVSATLSIYEADLCVPLGLVIGNEQKGMRPLVRKACDLLVRIPAGGPLQSLNAATAGAIALAEIQRQRLVSSHE